MNNFKLKAAVKKYSEQYENHPLEAVEAIGLDYDKEDADEIIAGLQATPLPKSNGHSDVYDTKPSAYSWFDEFDVRIQKREVRNPLLQRNESIITGWELQKKKHPKFIEPHIAVQLNSFCDGYDVLGVAPMLITKDTKRTGDVIPYADWAKEQGKNFAEDINILLNKPSE